MDRITSGIDWSAPSYDDVVARHSWHIPEALNIGEIACDRHANGDGRLALVAVEDDGTERTYSFDELKSLSDRLASGLASLGVKRGDRVAVFLPQRVECAVAHLAAFKLGAVSVPLSPLFRESALAYRLAHSGAKVVVTDDDHEPHLPSDRSAVVVGCDARGDAGFWDLVAEATPLERVVTRADDPAMIIYTSGTSGLPKGAVHGHRFLPGRLSGFELMHRLEGDPEDERPFWTPADWAWVGGLVDCVLTPWVFGCPVLGWRRRGFDPARVVELLQRRRWRALFFPPTALNRMRSVVPDMPAIDVASVHTAGEPLSPETLAWAKEKFGVVFELYGMTEMGATIGNSYYFMVKPGSMGKPVAGHVVVVQRADGTEAAVGEVGEIAVKTGDPGMFLGYLDDEAATRARFREGWFMTGDLAVRDDDGYLFYRGRSDDLISTAGYRVGPTEIEQCLLSHPAIEHAAVVGAPNAERGEIVKAFVVLREAFAPSRELRSSIQDHVKEKLAAYEYPRAIIFARELPMTTSGKIRRLELRSPDADARFGVEGGT